MLISCSTNEPSQPADNSPVPKIQSSKYNFRKIPDDSLQQYAYRTENSKEIKTETDFQSIKDFPSSWAGLSKNTMGLFIYHRGQGLAHNLTITNDTIRNGGYGEAVSWPIREFRKVNTHKYYFGLGLDTTNSTYARCTIEIIDVDTLYSIQSTQVFELTESGEKLLGEYSGLYVPIYNQHLFYHIDEPNKKDPSAWIPAEKIDLKNFRNKKTGYNKTYKQ